MTHEYRASELGGCEKMLAASRQGVKPLDKVSDTMEKVFARGHSHEAACIAVMETQGYIVNDQQKEVEINLGIEGVRLTGHLDGIIYATPDATPANRCPILEVKSPKSWQMFLDQMYNEEPTSLIQRYKWQISVYMVALQKEALYVCLDENYNLRQHQIELPFYNYEAIVERVQHIETLARTGLPRMCNPREYPCKYVFLHEDEDVTLDHDVEIDILAERYVKAKNVVEAAKKKQAAILDEIRVAAGDRKKIKTATASVTFYDRSNESIDKSAMVAAGLNPADFMKKSVSKDIPKIDWKGDDDEMS